MRCCECAGSLARSCVVCRNNILFLTLSERDARDRLSSLLALLFPANPRKLYYLRLSWKASAAASTFASTSYGLQSNLPVTPAEDARVLQHTLRTLFSCEPNPLLISLQFQRLQLIQIFIALTSKGFAPSQYKTCTSAPFYPRKRFMMPVGARLG